MSADPVVLENKINTSKLLRCWLNTTCTFQAGEKQQLPQLTEKDSISLHDIVAMLIRVFVDASPHIPEHRQLPLFTHLISTVGSVQFLHTAILLLLEKHVVQGANNPDDDKQVRQAIPLCTANVYSLVLAFLYQSIKRTCRTISVWL